MRRFKTMFLVRRTDTVDEARFLDAVRTEIAPRLTTACGDRLDGLVINSVEEMNFRKGAPTNVAGHVWSAILELYFADEAAMLAVIADEVPAVLEASSGVVAEFAAVPVTEIMMYDRLTSADPVKIFGLFHITGTMSRAEVHDYWYGPHAEMGLQLKADAIIRKYSQNHTLLGYVGPDPRYRYDGASIVYFDSVEDAGKIYRNPAVTDISEADELLMGTEPGAVVSIAAREELVFDHGVARQPAGTTA